MNAEDAGDSLWVRYIVYVCIVLGKVVDRTIHAVGKLLERQPNLVNTGKIRCAQQEFIVGICVKCGYTV